MLASIQSTAALVAAREAWLNDYVGAKRVIQGLLLLLGRTEDYRLYFKDLQVNEGGSGGSGGTGDPPKQGSPDQDSPKQDPPPQDSPAANTPQGT